MSFTCCHSLFKTGANKGVFRVIKQLTDYIFIQVLISVKILTTVIQVKVADAQCHAICLLMFYNV